MSPKLKKPRSPRQVRRIRIGLNSDRAAQDAAFAAFYRDFVPRLVAFLRWQGVPLSSAADLAQETMIQAYRRWSSIENPGAWCLRVASRMWARQISQTVDYTTPNPPDTPSLLKITECDSVGTAP